MRRKSYFSPLILAAQLPGGGDDVIIVANSVESGGTWGGECWDVVDQFYGEPAGKIIGCDGTLLGYLDTNDWILYDKNGNEVENFYEDYMGDVDWWLEDQGWNCYDACPQLADD